VETPIEERLVKIQRDISEQWDAEKKKIGADLTERYTRAEVDERLGQLKSSLDEDLKRKVEELVKASHEDPRYRVDLVPRREFSFYRSMAKTSTTQEDSWAIYRDFLTSHSDQKDVERFQYLSSRLAIISLGARLSGKTNYVAAASKNIQVRKWWHEYRQLQMEFFPDEFYQRAFDTQAINGAQGESLWVPDVLGADLMRYLEIRGAVLPNIRSFQLPAALWRCPITLAAGKAHGFREVVAAPTSYPDPTGAQMYDDASAPFGRVTFDVARFRSVIISTREFIEESIIPMIEWTIGEAMDGIRRAAEDTFFNGDKTSPGIDSETSYAAASPTGRVDNKILWNGVRANAAASGVTLVLGAGSGDFPDFVLAKQRCGRYAIEPSDWLWCCSPASYLDLLDVGEFATVEKIGERATVVTGQVGAILGSPVVVSEYVPSNVSASGYQTTSTNNTTMVIGFHRPSYWLGNWRGITTETDRQAIVNQDYVYAWYSADLQKMRAASEKTENVIINIAVA